jgi:response regulator of citrate/malate metabolism
VCGEASNGREKASSVEKLRPDLILLDPHLPRLNGIEAQQIHEAVPDGAILFASMDKDADTVRKTLHTGVMGYVLKTDAEVSSGLPS